MTRGVCTDPLNELKRRRKISEALQGHATSEETRKKLSEAKKGEKHPYFGKHLPKKIRMKISKALKEKHSIEEPRQKPSEVEKGKLSLIHISEPTRPY